MLSPAQRLAMVLAGLLGLAALLPAPAAASRRLTDSAPAAEPSSDPGQGEWIDGRATWFEHPYTGSCGYGKLDTGYSYGYDAVAAMPDVSPDYNSSCGRCYELKCRGIQATAADGSESWDRHDACYDTSKTIVIKIVDTCPCKGNEKWCCGDMPHFDLGNKAFAKLAPQGKGIIGLKFRPIPCELGMSASQQAAEQRVEASAGSPWDKMYTALHYGAAPDVFINGDLGIGWKKTAYMDSKQAMYTWDSTLEAQPDGSQAICDGFSMYGGLDFHAQNASLALFNDARAVEFWAKGGAGLAFRLANLMRGSCNKDTTMIDFATGDKQGDFTRYYFPMDAFDCTGSIKPSDITRLQWESKVGSASLCVRDVRVIMKA
ncbi:hypothetical protein ABPG75_008861 [Micractinium tetrahymenae]